MLLRKMANKQLRGVCDFFIQWKEHFMEKLTKIILIVADLKKGKVYKGPAADGVKVDTTITIDDSDMVDMAS